MGKMRTCGSANVTPNPNPNRRIGISADLQSAFYPLLHTVATKENRIANYPMYLLRSSNVLSFVNEELRTDS